MQKKIFLFMFLTLSGNAFAQLENFMYFWNRTDYNLMDMGFSYTSKARRPSDFIPLGEWSPSANSNAVGMWIHQGKPFIGLSGIDLTKPDILSVENPAHAERYWVNQGKTPEEAAKIVRESTSSYFREMMQPLLNEYRPVEFMEGASALSEKAVVLAKNGVLAPELAEVLRAPGYTGPMLPERPSPPSTAPSAASAATTDPLNEGAVKLLMAAEARGGVASSRAIPPAFGEELNTTVGRMGAVLGPGIGFAGMLAILPGELKKAYDRGVQNNIDRLDDNARRNKEITGTGLEWEYGMAQYDGHTGSFTKKDNEGLWLIRVRRQLQNNEPVGPWRVFAKGFWSDGVVFSGHPRFPGGKIIVDRNGLKKGEAWNGFPKDCK